MQDRLYDWKYTGWILAIFYVVAVFCLPWAHASYSYYRAINEQHSKNTEEPAHSVFVFSERPESSEEAAQTKRQIEQCTTSFFCRVVDFRAIRLADVATDDPVALFTIVLAFSTIGLWWQTWQLANAGEETSRHQLRAYLAVARPRFRASERAVRFNVVNTGLTPAKRIRVQQKVHFCKYAEIPQMLNEDWANQTFFCGSGRDIRFRYHLPDEYTDADWIEHFAQTDKRFYLTVRIEFEDIFGRPHWLITRGMLGPPNEKGTSSIYPCNEGNDGS